MNEFNDFFDSITPAGSYDENDPTHRALRYTQEIAWRAGREQGMREAVDIAKRFEPDERHPHVTYPSDAILAAIGEGK